MVQEHIKTTTVSCYIWKVLQHMLNNVNSRHNSQHSQSQCGIRLLTVYVYRKITIPEAFQQGLRNAWSVLG
jgi:hypothetical protein